MITELDLLSLLEEADNILKEKRAESLHTTKSATWLYSPGTITCRSCRRIYKGTIFHASHAPTNQFVLSCPRCPIDEKLWWLHHKLDLEEVIEGDPVEKTESLNDITIVLTRPHTGTVY
jgi:hypothetical protein